MPVPLAQRCVRMGSMATPSATRPSQFRAWLQLMRIANLPTAISNVMAGYLIVEHQWNADPLGWLTLISCLMYSGGMVLNDAFDADVDSHEKPLRAIPRGAVTRASAFKIGFAMLLLGVLVSLLVSPLRSLNYPRYDYATTIAAIGLAGMIVLYNGVLKRTILAPSIMGGCRTLNILLAGSVITAFESSRLSEPLRRQILLVDYAVWLGFFITAITSLARHEAQSRQSRSRIVLSVISLLALLLGLAWYGYRTSIRFFNDNPSPDYSVSTAFVTLVALVAFPIVRHSWIACASATPKAVGQTIVTSLNSLIFLDAAVCFLVRPDQPLYAGAVALLIIPVMLLRRFSAQT